MPVCLPEVLLKASAGLRSRQAAKQGELPTVFERTTAQHLPIPIPMQKKELPGETTGSLRLEPNGARPVETKPNAPEDAEPFFCARCASELWPGAGDFYQITIEAVADPTPPTLTAEDLATDIRQKIEHLLAEMEGLSAQEALDQVYRHMILHLCGPCYRQWIENPMG